jgi:ubiquinone biosynthesis monooxygenase Coq7
MTRHYSRLDKCLINLDQGLRTVFGRPVEQRPSPTTHIPDPKLSPSERKLSIGLMRVNHAGEISAQALYQAQALTAQSPSVHISMKQAAEEENDHLAWCKGRLDELGSHTSYLSPLWYLGSFGIGVIAGLAGDKWSLGFLAETEKQVVRHLEKHLEKLPEEDQKSREIVTQMKADEAEHASMAVKTGGAELPKSIQKMMALFSKVMTKTAYWV